MKTAVLDAGAADRRAVFASLAAQLGFAAETVPNLDALWDVLRTDTPGPFAVVWHDHARARAALGEDFERIAALLADLATERADFSFTLA
ncbi:MAG: barstar family protein [Rhodospirillales bacterium]